LFALSAPAVTLVKVTESVESIWITKPPIAAVLPQAQAEVEKKRAAKKEAAERKAA
jgi:hypothetical protein